jgi:hypothetical protein
MAPPYYTRDASPPVESSSLYNTIVSTKLSNQGFAVAPALIVLLVILGAMGLVICHQSTE